jgi:hypothetical protein
MAALASSAPAPAAPQVLKLNEAGDDAWTGEEIAHAAVLVKAARADREHWLLGEWLAPRVLVGIRGRKTGTGRTLADLGQQVGASHYLRQLRDTAHHWPAATPRLPAARFHVHGAFRNGGCDHAAWRREQLLTMDATPARVTANCLRRSREAQGEHRRGRVTGSRALPVSDFELVRRLDELLHDIDQRLCQGGSERLLAPVRADLDARAGNLERLELALAGLVAGQRGRS